MIQSVKNNLTAIDDFESKKYLLAVSGGVDSMVLIHLFESLSLHFCIAHCNFKLRDKESDLDENLVLNSARKSDVPFFNTSFATLDFAVKNGISTQMAARDLRYSWFEKMASENQYDYIVTAHHLNDQIETVFLNLTRGSGIDGITGMSFAYKNIIRPLLSVTKQDVLEYAKKHKIKFREDASNASDKYKRNLIRNKIIPLFEELNPSFLRTMEKNISIFNSVAQVYSKSIEKQLSDNLITTQDDLFIIELEKLKSMQNPLNLLYEFIKKFGFNIYDSEQIMEHVFNDFSGEKTFNSMSHNIMITRSELVMSPKKIKNIAEENTLFYINELDNSISYPLSLSLQTQDISQFNLIKNKDVAFFDLTKINFPLVLRKWKNGDVFQPFGMQGKKKLSDFFIDTKLSLSQKKEVYVLLSDNEIIWIVGHRASENYRITSTTKQVLKIQVKK